MKEEKVVEFVDSLIEENESVPVIVEGKRDERALRRLGLKGEILVFNSGMSITTFCENVVKNYRRVILFLDWDRKGNDISMTMKKILVSGGVSCNIEFREYIKSVVGNSIRSVEEIYPLYVLSLEKLSLKGVKSSGKKFK